MGGKTKTDCRSRLPTFPTLLPLLRTFSVPASTIRHRHGSPHCCVHEHCRQGFSCRTGCCTAAHKRLGRPRARCAETENRSHNYHRTRHPSTCRSSPRSFAAKIGMALSPSRKNIRKPTGVPRFHRRNHAGKTHGCGKRWSRRKSRSCCGDARTR